VLWTLLIDIASMITSTHFQDYPPLLLIYKEVSAVYLFWTSCITKFNVPGSFTNLYWPIVSAPAFNFWSAFFRSDVSFTAHIEQALLFRSRYMSNLPYAFEIFSLDWNEALHGLAYQSPSEITNDAYSYRTSSYRIAWSRYIYHLQTISISKVRSPVSYSSYNDFSCFCSADEQSTIVLPTAAWLVITFMADVAMT